MKEKKSSGDAERDVYKVLVELRATLYSIGDGVIVTDATGHVTRMNPIACALTGWSEADAVGTRLDDVFRIVSEKTGVAIDNPAERVMREGKTVLLANDTLLIARDWTARPISDCGAPILDEQGAIIGMVLVFHDQTTERAAKKALEESEEKFRTFFDRAHDGMLIADATNKKFLYGNSAICSMLGYAQEELKNLTVSDIHPPKDLPRVFSTFEKLVKGEKALAENLPVLRKDGTTFYADISAAPHVLGEIPCILGIFRDITERRQAEAELRESEEKYRRLVETTGTGYVIIDDQGHVIDANQEYVQLTGRQRLEEIVGHSVLEWTAPNCYEYNAAAVRQCADQGFIRNLEIDYISPNGRTTPVELNATVFPVPGAVRILTLCRNITKRRRAEDELRESESKYRELFEKMINGFSHHKLILDEGDKPVDYVFLEVNTAFEKITGLKKTDILGKRVTEVIPGIEHDPANWIGIYGKVALTGEDVRFEQHSDALGKWYSVLAYSPIKGFFATIFEDITERKQAEEALRESENFLKSIYRAAPTGIGVVSNRVLTSVNDRVCEMSGYSREELVGKNARILYPSDADYEYVGAEKYRQIKERGTGTVETRWLRKDGRTIDVLMSSTPINQQDFSVGVTFTALDITERKQAETEKEKLQAQLLQSQKMESVGRLAGGVAHDFNNMLAVIMGHVALAMLKINPSEPLHAHLAEIQNAAQRSADLTRQLLAFARKQTVAPKVLDLNETVAGMFKMLLRLIGEDINLVWMPGAGLWPIKMDPSQVDQLLANLCVNARDAISGVGRVTIETENVSFDEAYCALHEGHLCGEYVMLGVSDNGKGMSKEVLDHLFEPFFTTKEVGKGTGLGLATVYGIVKQNEGFICVSSDPSNGTSFKIYLPRFVGDVREPKIVITKEAPRGRGEVVLLVEDELSVLNVSRSMLEGLGYTVLTANRPGEALAQAKAHTAEIQLLITDVVMPEMHGRDLAKLIREIKPGLKCLFISGYTTDVIAHRGVLDEAVYFLQKPFSIKELASKVSEALHGA